MKLVEESKAKAAENSNWPTTGSQDDGSLCANSGRIVADSYKARMPLPPTARPGLLPPDSASLARECAPRADKTVNSFARCR